MEQIMGADQATLRTVPTEFEGNYAQYNLPDK
jgi:hypothetical protein